MAMAVLRNFAFAFAFDAIFIVNVAFCYCYYLPTANSEKETPFDDIFAMLFTPETESKFLENN